MKSPLPLVVFVLMAQAASAQAHLDSIARKTCSCVKKLDIDTEMSELNVKLGTCMIEYAMPFKQELLAQNGIDLDQFDSENGLKMGKLVGSRMLAYCPDFLAKLGGKAKTRKAEVLQKQGTITAIKRSDFVTIEVTDQTKSVTKFLWLTNFPGSDALAKIEKPGQKVTITYEVKEFYDSKLKDYRNYNVITEAAVN